MFAGGVIGLPDGMLNVSTVSHREIFAELPQQDAC